MVSPPKPGDESYPLWKEETDLIQNNLKSRSYLMAEHFNKMEGVSCNNAEGAMYLFPRINIPPKAVEAAKKLGKEPDVMYALDLLGESPFLPFLLLPTLFFFLLYLVDADENDNLDATGICAVAGSGFGQEPGTFHLRVTALCPDTAEFIGRFQKFNKEFMEKYA